MTPMEMLFLARRALTSRHDKSPSSVLTPHSPRCTPDPPGGHRFSFDPPPYPDTPMFTPNPAATGHALVAGPQPRLHPAPAPAQGRRRQTAPVPRPPRRPAAASESLPTRCRRGVVRSRRAQECVRPVGAAVRCVEQCGWRHVRTHAHTDTRGCGGWCGWGRGRERGRVGQGRGCRCGRAYPPHPTPRPRCLWRPRGAAPAAAAAVFFTVGVPSKCGQRLGGGEAPGVVC